MGHYIEHHTYVEHRTLKKVGVIVTKITCKGEVVDTRQEYNVDYVTRHDYTQSRWVCVLDKLRTRSFSLQLRNSIEDLKRSNVHNVSLHSVLTGPYAIVNLHNISLAYELLNLGCGLNYTTIRDVTLPQILGFGVAPKLPQPSVHQRCQAASKQLALQICQPSNFVFPGIEPVNPNCRLLVEFTGGIDMVNRAFINWVWDDQAHTQPVKDRRYPPSDLLRNWINSHCPRNQESLLPVLLYSVMTKETDMFQILNPTTFVANWSPFRPGPFIRLTPLCAETDKIVWFAQHIAIVKRTGANAPIFQSYLNLSSFPTIMAEFWKRLITQPVDIDIPQPTLANEATHDKRWISWHEAFITLWEAFMPDLPIYEGPHHMPTYQRLAWPNGGNGKPPQLYCVLPHRTNSITETLPRSTPPQFFVLSLPTRPRHGFIMRNYLRVTLYPVKNEYLDILADTMKTVSEFRGLIKHLEMTHGLRCSASGDKGQFLTRLMPADNPQLGEAIRRYVFGTCEHLTVEDLQLTTPKKSLLRSVAFSMANKYRPHHAGDPVGCYAKPTTAEEILGTTFENAISPDLDVTYIKITGLATPEPTYWFMVNDHLWKTHVENEFATVKLSSTFVTAELTIFEPRRKYKLSEKKEYRRTHPDDSKGPRAKLPPAARVCGSKIWLTDLFHCDLENVSRHLRETFNPCCMSHSDKNTNPAFLTMCFLHHDDNFQPPSLSYRSIMSLLRQKNIILRRVPIVSTSKDYEMSGRPNPVLLSQPRIPVSMYQRRVEKIRRLKKQKREKAKQKLNRLKTKTKARLLDRIRANQRRVETKAKPQAKTGGRQ
ncbi:PREDICTED: uncharacterized protein LOC109473294 [Branchiostoma belcheri]|uniref:Uncharacterized protein LOC109473294 n=1 Tax=Branchiostoma belcheri TaxID=7741 RepID=A0A6P4ZCA8_BRABE|nr:PREDICTED: uncharacterized protein LOC109473294 [Branchiostoma belcheri]